MAWATSVGGALRNFRRAGVAKNRSRTSTRVPGGCAAGRASAARPASISIVQALGMSRDREVTVSRDTAPIEGRASPRKPRVAMRLRSSWASFDVACRSTASAISSGLMPQPSSATEISVRPPPRSVTSIRVAPASRLFSTSSLTAEAGRSTTSPAAMRLISDFWKAADAHQAPARISLKALISPLVEASWLETAASLSSSGRITLASCLPSSTPHWSNELISQITPCVKILCS